MDPKDVAHGYYASLEQPRKRAPPPSLNLLTSIDNAFPPESPMSTPGSASVSPATPALLRRTSTASTSSEPHQPETPKDPSSGPQRARSASASGTKGEKEKRKRSRVTPDQLVHLERFFSVDRSPTAARRKEISDLLGMQERQTQIWFQNRRAKAKLQDGKVAQGDTVETPPDTPPQLSTGYEEDLHALIHENEPVTIIPCTDLSIGTWRRIATTVGKHDLVAYLSDRRRCLTWFIHSAGYGFKMEIPFDFIVDTEFTNAAPGSGLASFVLNQPPTFFLEDLSSPRADGTVQRKWKRCADWTEGQQASKVLRHDLIGSAVQLAHVLRNIQVDTPGSDIQLHSPSYQPQVDMSAQPLSPVELPAPPMAGLPGFRYVEEGSESPQMDPQRPHSGPASLTHLDELRYPMDVEPRAHGVPALERPHTSAVTGAFGQYAGDFAAHGQGHLAQTHGHEHRASVYGAAPLVHPYSAPPIHRSFYRDDGTRASPEYMNTVHRRSSYQSFHSPSPPYQEPALAHMGRSHSHPEALSSAGMPSAAYDSEGDMGPATA